MITPLPSRPGFYRFTGIRSVRVAQTIHLDTILYVDRLPHRRELAVLLVGRREYFRLDSFTGDFEFIYLKKLVVDQSHPEGSRNE